MADQPRVVVVGLGPGGPDLLTVGTVEAIAACPTRFLRTRRHPAALAVPEATSFDDVYDAADTLDAVYPAIVERLV
ncbi:MAG TPA: SAM-dependent methyltransferase, partial [Acidimicrobiales bacterium]